MESISVTQAARGFSDLLNRVHYQGISFELTRGNRVIALLSPAEAPRGAPIERLDGLFASFPKLEDDDDWEAELDELRANLPKDQDPWAS